MTIETYNLQFHMVKAENSQDVQNRFLLYHQVQSGTLAELEKERALRARQQVPDANESEGKQVEPDDDGHNARARRRGRRDGQDSEEGSRTGRSGSGGGQLIDVTV